ncbi:Hypothetical protein CINCED_3A016140 [Cinara cedri]|uniref:Uncharacterized protein n=1 Tax=Cinara cedri TaxID=506608 RepID=A0A5E4N5R7_9HEMI|nr:Hypothetical protein CINCED_3A016140 [Cinara cedri]
MKGPTGWGIYPLSLLESFAWNFPPARGYCDTLVPAMGAPISLRQEKINNMTRQYEKRNNIEIQQLYKEPDIVAVLKNRRMTWAGHIWRSNGLMKEVLKWKPQGKRALGRPKQRWIDKVEKNLAEIGIRDGETTAHDDRDRWKQICVAVMGLNGL